MKTQKLKKNQQGVTLIEMVAAIVILGIVVLGVAQYLVVSRLNVHLNNLRAGIAQNTADVIVQHQSIPGEWTTNVAVNADLAPYVVPNAKNETVIHLVKKRTDAGVYLITGDVSWRLFANPNGVAYHYATSLQLQVPE